MPFHRGKFGPSAPKGSPSMGKPIAGGKPEPQNEHEKKHGMAQAAHGGGQEKHVKDTHPGATTPHPETGVHAFHAHHKGGEHGGGGAGGASGGGSSYTTHTHHDDGQVETKENRSQQEMEQDKNDAFPQSAENEMPNEPMGDSRDQYADTMSGIGGSSGTSV